jgi:hypothetical protein
MGEKETASAERAADGKTTMQDDWNAQKAASGGSHAGEPPAPEETAVVKSKSNITNN